MVIEGGDLEYAGDLSHHSHHQLHQHQLHQHQETLPKPYDPAASNGGYYYQQHPTTVPPSSPNIPHSSATLKEDRILGLKPRTLLIITTALLVLLTSAVALVGGLLGSKIANLERNSPSPSPTDPRNSSTPTATAPQPAFTTNTRVGGFKYVGCYIDGNDRILPEHGVEAASNMTNQICANACTEAGKYKYFGTESRDQCYCANNLASDAADRKANEWNCGMNCAGSDAKKQEICGGNFFISVWERV